MLNLPNDAIISIPKLEVAMNICMFCCKIKTIDNPNPLETSDDELLTATNLIH